MILKKKEWLPNCQAKFCWSFSIFQRHSHVEKSFLFLSFPESCYLFKTFLPFSSVRNCGILSFRESSPGKWKKIKSTVRKEIHVTKTEKCFRAISLSLSWLIFIIAHQSKCIYANGNETNNLFRRRFLNLKLKIDVVVKMKCNTNINLCKL